MISLSEVGLGCAPFGGLDILDFIDLASRHGFGKIGGNPFMLDAAVRRGLTRSELRSHLASRGISVGMLDALSRSLPGVLTYEDLDPTLRARYPPDMYTNPDEDTCLKYAVDFGTRVVNAGAVFNGQVAVDDMADGVRVLCRVAAPLGLRISLECVPYSGLPTLDYVQSVLQEVGEPNCAVTLDAYHLSRAGATIDDVRRLPAGVIATLQVSDRIIPTHETVGVIDRRRLMPGSGELPLHDLLATVLENSPDAYIEVEVLNDAFAALLADDLAAQLAEHTRMWLAAATQYLPDGTCP
jgi:sugar phosphate isomerase/epimerase